MAELEDNIKNNREKMEALITKSQQNSDSLIENKNLIKERRESIISNRDAIMNNKSKIFD